MDKLRIAVVGVGFWGQNHIRVLSELSEVELVAICDLNRKKIDNITSKYGIKGYINSERMIKNEKLEAVTICVWSTNLYKESIKALNSGLNVFVEKPMANSSEQANSMIDLARKKELSLMVGFIERFNPAVIRLKEIIREGKLGKPVSITIKRVSKWPERIGDVGVIIDTSIHDIDMTRFIFGEDPIAVFARGGNINHEKFEDHIQIMLAFSNGKSAFLEANWLTPYKIRKLTFTGSEAIVYLDYITQEITIETLGETFTPRHEWEEPLKLELGHFINCLLDHQDTLVKGIDGFNALRIAEAALKSAKICKLVEL